MVLGIGTAPKWAEKQLVGQRWHRICTSGELEPVISCHKSGMMVNSCCVEPFLAYWLVSL